MLHLLVEEGNSRVLHLGSDLRGELEVSGGQLFRFKFQCVKRVS